MQNGKRRKHDASYRICFYFNLQLPLDHLQKNLAKETEKLKEMAPHLSEDQDGQGTFHLNGHRLEFKEAIRQLLRILKCLA